MARRDPNGYSRLDLAFVREARRWAEFQKDADKAKRFALRKLGRSLPVAWRKDIQSTVNLKASEIRDRIDVNVHGDSVLLIGRRRPIGLINFGGKWPGLTRTGPARRRSPGASAKKYRNRERYFVDGDSAFIATGLSGNRHIFSRTGEFGIATKGRYAGKRREKLEAYYGPPMPAFFRNAERQARMFVVAAEIFEKELARVRKFV